MSIPLWSSRGSTMTIERYKHNSMSSVARGSSLRSNPLFLVVSVVVCAWVGMETIATNQLGRALYLLRERTSYDHSPDKICQSVHNHPLIHDSRQDVIDEYEAIWNMRQKHKATTYEDDKDPPGIQTLPKGGNYAVWEAPLGHMWASAWNNSTIVKSPGFVPPVCQHAVREVPREDFGCTSHYVRPVNKEHHLEGDYFGFTSTKTYEGHYGHYKHDMLPTIAYYHDTLPKTTKFILLDRETIEFIDPDFARDRVVWIQFNDVVRVSKGSLTVGITPNRPFLMYHDLLNRLRLWVMKEHPEVPEERTVIYYRRLQSNAKKGRVLNRQQEQDVLSRIESAMKHYNRKERLVVFDGTDANDEEMSLSDQYHLFRSANTIVGPHGTGLGGNLLWTNPSPKDCEDRVQLLEFITDGSEELKSVHGSYTTHYNGYRGLPINYHNLFYLRNSSQAETFIDSNMVSEFLDDVWGKKRPAAITKEE